MTRPTAATRVAGIVGWPASRSLSPVIHNAAFRAAGLDWVYVAFPVAPDDVAAAVAGIRGMGIAGVNVTMPHKQAVIPLLDDVTPAAGRIGAVNTIVNDGGRLIGDNTDGEGFLAFLIRGAGFDPASRRVVLLGAGGAARALGVALTDAGASVTIAARRDEAARELAGESGAVACAWQDRGTAAHEADLIVNATPAGSRDDGSPLGSDDIPSSAVVVDLVYAPPVTSLLRDASARGAAAHNGIGMLVHQAALSFERWTGVPAPVEAMWAAASESSTNPSL